MNTFVLNQRGSALRGIFTLLIVMALIAACAGQPQATQAPAEQAPAEVEAQAPAEAEAPEVTEAPADTEPAAEEPAATEAMTEEPAAEEGPVTEDFSPEIPDPEEPVVISFASWAHTGEEDDAWETLAAEFNAIHPNITIEFQDVPAEEMNDKLLTQIAANNPPDTAYIDSGTTGDFAARNALVNLDDYISKSSVIDLEDYVPAFLIAAQVEGSTYGLPIDGESTGLFYRLDRFEEAGLDPNHPPETWEEFREYAELLTDPANNKYGYAVFAPEAEAAYYFLPWLWQAGGDTLNPENPDDVIWDSLEGQKAGNFYVDLAQFSPPDLLASNSWDGRVSFANGDVAMYMAGAWFAGELLSQFPEATGLWAAAPLPQDERCATTIAGDHLVIFNGSENPDAAFKWIEFVSAPENMAELNLGTEESPATLLPPRISLLEDPSIYENRPFMQGFADNMQCAVVSTTIQPKYGEMEQVLGLYLGRAFYGEMDGATAVIESAKEAEVIAQQD